MQTVPLKFLLQMMELAGVDENHELLNQENSQVVVESEFSSDIMKLVYQKEEDVKAEIYRKKQKMEEIKYAYIREAAHQNGRLYDTGRVITVARRMFDYEHGPDLEVQYAIAICNPDSFEVGGTTLEGDSFCKKIGRDISSGRLEIGFGTSITVHRKENILKAVVRDIQAYSPHHCAREMASEWLEQAREELLAIIEEEVNGGDIVDGNFDIEVEPIIPKAYIPKEPLRENEIAGLWDSPSSTLKANWRS